MTHPLLVWCNCWPTLRFVHSSFLFYFFLFISFLPPTLSALPCQWPGSAFCKATTTSCHINIAPQLHWKSKGEIPLSLLMYPIFQKQSPKLYSYGLKSHIKGIMYLLTPPLSFIRGPPISFIRG